MTRDTVDLEHLRAWVGSQEQSEDEMAAFPLNALAATLDRDDPPAATGAPLPPAAHWVYFLPLARASELGPDGHPARGGFLPPVPLPRRMWAGSRVTYDRPLRIGERARRLSTVTEVTPKNGRSGQLVFVKVRHEFAPAGADTPALVEEQDIVYREAAAPGTAAPTPTPTMAPAPEGAEWTRTVEPDPVLLFRYSALIFNAHRIHYDHPYVTREEGYPGLIVHGPLIATLLADLFRRQRPDATVRSFAFRARSPLFDTGPFTVNGDPTDTGARLWATGPDGGLASDATVTV